MELGDQVRAFDRYVRRETVGPDRLGRGPDRTEHVTHPRRVRSAAAEQADVEVEPAAPLTREGGEHDGRRGLRAVEEETTCSTT